MSESTPREFRFFHADRASQLKTGQRIELGEDNLSVFGRLYWQAIKTLPESEQSEGQRREWGAEEVKNWPHHRQKVSRMQAFFGANSIEEAASFGNSIQPRPAGPLPIFEIFATHFYQLDSNWLDVVSPDLENFVHYWSGEICNHLPSVGERRPPMIEIVMALPVRVGELVGWAQPDGSLTRHHGADATPAALSSAP